MSQFNTNPQLTGIIQEVGQCEGGFIADKLFPIVKTPCNFGWVDWKCTNQFDTYEDKVGCYSAPNEIDGPTWEYKYDKVQSRYLSTPICELDLACHNDAGGCNNPTFDLEAMHAEMLFNKLRLAREVRTITSAFDVTQYDPTAGVIDGGLTDGTGLLDDPEALKIWLELIGCSEFGYNCLVVNKKVAIKLITAPAFLNKNCCGPNFGLKQSLQNIADLIGVQEIVVSDVKVNSAPAGLPKDVNQVLDDSALLIRNSNLPSSDCPNRTFGFTAQFRDTYAARAVDDCKGGRGVLYIKAGWDIKEVVADRKMAHLITNLCA